MVHILAQVTARPEAATAMRAVFMALTGPTRAEPGCIDYQVYEDTTRPGSFMTVECWRDQAAVDAHMAAPHVAAAFASAGPLLAQPPAIVPYQRLP